MNKYFKRIRYGNLNKIPTYRIKAILDDPYTRGKDGKDYEPVRHELEEILWSRMGAHLIEAELREIERQERERERELALVPPIPSLPMPLETPELPLIRVLEYQGEEITSFREFWKLGTEFLEIPNVVLDF